MFVYLDFIKKGTREMIEIIIGVLGFVALLGLIIEISRKAQEK